MSLFTQKAPTIMRKLMADFALTDEDAAAIVGNLGHETRGFEKLQEISPTVKGSRGGYGWAQWTGPRRRAYEAYCKRNGLDPASDKANYGFLWVELTTTETAAIPAVKRAVGLAAKVKAFELGFERAGIKHYDSRVKYAGWALAAYHAEQPSNQPQAVVTPENSAAVIASGAGIGIAATGAQSGWGVAGWLVAIGCVLLAVGATYFGIRFYRRVTDGKGTLIEDVRDTFDIGWEDVRADAREAFSKLKDLPPAWSQSSTTTVTMKPAPAAKKAGKKKPAAKRNRAA
jgi:hypothetical protein